MSETTEFALTRRAFAGVAATGALAAIAPSAAAMNSGENGAATSPSGKPGSFWPNGARLAISISLMFEGGGQPISGAGGPLSEPIKPGFPDQPTNAFFAHGVNEGIPRALDLFDKHNIKVTSFMIGKAIEQHPELAREIVRRGHEAAAHGPTWSHGGKRRVIRRKSDGDICKRGKTPGRNFWHCRLTGIASL